MKTVLKLALSMAALLLVSGMNPAAAQKFGYINIQELVFSMPEMTEVQTNFEALQKDLEAQYETMVVEYRKKADEFQRTSSTMTDGVRQMREQELTDMLQRIQAFEQTVQVDLEKKQNELLEPLFSKANDAVKTVAKANGLTAVLASGALAYVDEATMVDVLPLAKSHLGIQ